LGWQEGSLPVSEKASQETLALPLYPVMTAQQIAAVLESVENSFSRGLYASTK